MPELLSDHLITVFTARRRMQFESRNDTIKVIGAPAIRERFSEGRSNAFLCAPNGSASPSFFKAMTWTPQTAKLQAFATPSDPGPFQPRA